MAAGGLEALQGHYDGLILGGTFGALTAVTVSEAYEAGENERVSATVANTPVTLPSTVIDEDTGEARAPKDFACVVVDGGNSYVFEHASWVRLNDLGLNDEAPLSRRLKNWLTGELAIRLADEYGVPVPAACVADAASGRSTLTHKAPTAREPVEFF